jgi:hypothetical protein
MLLTGVNSNLPCSICGGELWHDQHCNVKIQKIRDYNGIYPLQWYDCCAFLNKLSVKKLFRESDSATLATRIAYEGIEP